MFKVDDLTMLIGGGRAGQLLEVGLATSDEGNELIVHAMVARPKYLR